MIAVANPEPGMRDEDGANDQVAAAGAALDDATGIWARVRERVSSFFSFWR
jgi:hypothetical protein